MSLNTLRRSLSMALWRGADRVAEAADARPSLRVAGLWWWHHGLCGGSFAAGTGLAVAFTGGTGARIAEAALCAAGVWVVGKVAEAVHVISFIEGCDGGVGCPFCADTGGDDGPDDGDEPGQGPDAPDDHALFWPVEGWCPDTVAGLQALASGSPAARQDAVNAQLAEAERKFSSLRSQTGPAAGVRAIEATGRSWPR
jgi:hypothetical protein